jgi:UDP-N-acetylmuramate dehydrogenase
LRLSEKQIARIERMLRGGIQRGVPLSKHTTFKIGGPADIVAEPSDRAALASLFRFVNEEQIPTLVLGGGSNILFSDQGFRGVVIRTYKLNRIEFVGAGSGTVRASAEAGVSLQKLINEACKRNLTGLETLWGIPGSVGGSVAVNAGAGEVSMGSLIKNITLLGHRGEEVVINARYLKYGYRRMDLPDRAVLVHANLSLKKGDPDQITSQLEETKSRRKLTQPEGVFSAGCVFKNPSPDNPAGAIIDRLGFKGKTQGGAGVSEVHANFIVNLGNATAADVLSLIEAIRAKALAEENVELELEIRVVREDAGYGS